MTAATIAKLEALHPLPDADKALLHAILGRGRTVKPRTEILPEGELNRTVYVILDGQGYCPKSFDDGRRQINRFLLPGDICDLYGFLFNANLYGITARTTCRFAELQEDHVEVLTSRPMLARALWLSELASMSILQTWLVNVRKNPSHVRVAHMLCELLSRLQVVDRAGQSNFEFEFSQSELGEATGLTTVAVNRSLQFLKRSGLISQFERNMQVPDVGALQVFGHFDPSYLQVRAAARNHPLSDVRSEKSTGRAIA